MGQQLVDNSSSIAVIAFAGRAAYKLFVGRRRLLAAAGSNTKERIAGGNNHRFG